MVNFKPFKALRPKEEYAKEVCCLPYDVLSPEDVRKLYEKSEISFARVIRSEADIENLSDIYAPEVYEKAAENLKKMEDDGILFSEEAPCYYIYSQTVDSRTQTGVLGVVSVEDYKDNFIRKHELTFAAKENDRINHFLACKAHTEPVFLMCHKDEALKWFIKKNTDTLNPEYDFTDDNGVNHKLWAVSDNKDIESLMLILNGHEAFYIADGHHRTASAAKISDKLAKPGDDGSEEYNYFMAVVFPVDELNIIDYNRLVTDFGEISESEFLKLLEEDFEVTEVDEFKKPSSKHMFSMYLGSKAYRLYSRPESYKEDSIEENFDTYILQKNIFSKILDITDPTNSSRLSFVGGIKGYGYLKEAVDSGSMTAAFGLFPVNGEDIMEVADNKLIMPPKSTWFEPKLTSGLFIHKFS